MKGWAQLAVHADVHTEIQKIAEREKSSLSGVVARAVSLYGQVSEQESALREGVTVQI